MAHLTRVPRQTGLHRELREHEERTSHTLMALWSSKYCVKIILWGMKIIIVDGAWTLTSAQLAQSHKSIVPATHEAEVAGPYKLGV